jgi:hypothetical protein
MNQSGTMVNGLDFLNKENEENRYSPYRMTTRAQKTLILVSEHCDLNSEFPRSEELNIHAWF